jgi:hypothetical protein
VYVHAPPPSQKSTVQASPSSQPVGVKTQPISGSQLSSVQVSSSSQNVVLCQQTPPAQKSVVQGLVSAQSIGVLEQPAT